MYLMVTSLANEHNYLEMAEFEHDYYYDWSEYMPRVEDMRDYDASHIFAVVTALEVQLRREQLKRLREHN